MSSPTPEEGCAGEVWILNGGSHRGHHASLPPDDAGDGASGGGESIYSTVIEKGRWMCKYNGHCGWGGGHRKEEGVFELLPQTLPRTKN